MAYSNDYRKRAVEHRDTRHTFVELREAFKIPPLTTGNRNLPRGTTEKATQTQDRPGKTQAGRGRKTRRIPTRTGETVRLYVPGRVLHAREAWDNPEKKSFTYREKPEGKRAEFAGRLKRIPRGKRVYVDESGVSGPSQRENGRAPVAERYMT